MAERIDNDREIQLKISLAGAKPPIWRRVLVRESMTLADLHRVIQIAMGWLDCHLYEFEVKGKQYTNIDPNAPPEAIDSRQVNLRNLRLRRRGVKFQYDYDFGDDWRHVLEVERTGSADETADYPRCLAGRRACPPEDSGGVHAYARMLRIASSPSHPGHEELSGWLPSNFDPARFDVQAVNEALLESFGDLVN